MKKEISLVVGSTSWWKNKKYRKEASKQIKSLRKKWKIVKVGEKDSLNDSIDTKIYKKYYLYK